MYLVISCGLKWHIFAFFFFCRLSFLLVIKRLHVHLFLCQQDWAFFWFWECKWCSDVVWWWVLSYFAGVLRFFDFLLLHCLSLMQKFLFWSFLLILKAYLGFKPLSCRLLKILKDSNSYRRILLVLATFVDQRIKQQCLNQIKLNPWSSHYLWENSLISSNQWSWNMWNLAIITLLLMGCSCFYHLLLSLLRHSYLHSRSKIYMIFGTILNSISYPWSSVRPSSCFCWPFISLPDLALFT